MNHPDPKLHQWISFVKSATRIVGGIAAVVLSADVQQAVVILGLSLVIAEIIGIVEELV